MSEAFKWSLVALSLVGVILNLAVWGIVAWREVKE